jgi:hypothetical protein
VEEGAVKKSELARLHEDVQRLMVAATRCADYLQGHVDGLDPDNYGDERAIRRENKAISDVRAALQPFDEWWS